MVVAFEAVFGDERLDILGENLFGQGAGGLGRRVETIRRLGKCESSPEAKAEDSRPLFTQGFIELCWAPLSSRQAFLASESMDRHKLRMDGTGLQDCDIHRA